MSFSFRRFAIAVWSLKKTNEKLVKFRVGMDEICLIGNDFQMLTFLIDVQVCTNTMDAQLVSTDVIQVDVSFAFRSLFVRARVIATNAMTRMVWFGSMLLFPLGVFDIVSDATPTTKLCAYVYWAPSTKLGAMCLCVFDVAAVDGWGTLLLWLGS